MQKRSGFDNTLAELNGTYVPVGSTAYVAQVAAPTGVAATDTAAIHAARDAAGVGGKLVFQAGTYATTGLTANVASQTWDCRGATFTSTGAATPVLRLAAAGITVEGGTFSGASGTGTGITNTAGDSCTVRNATVSATSSYGIYAANVNYVTIDGCYVTGSADIGIFVEVTTGSDIVGPTISRCRVDRTALGAGLTEGAIKVHGTGTLKVQRAKIHDNRVLMPTSPVSINCICIEVWNGCPYASIRGNHTYGGAMGVSVDRSDYTAVSGNVIFGASSTGVEVPQSIGVAVSGNTIDGNDLCLRGVWIDGSSTYSTGTTVSANAIRRCTTHGVHQVNGNDLVVSGNTIKHDTAGALNGVYIQGVTGFAVTGNLIDCGGVGSRCVVIDTSTDGPITGNHFRQPVNPPVLLTVASAFTIDHVSVVGNASTGLAGGAVVSTSTSGGGAVSTNFNQWLNGDGQNRLNNTNVRVHTSTGTPESVFSADPGSLFMRSDGSVASALYVKGSGTGTTGWVAMDPVDEDTLTTGEPTMKRRFVSSSGVTRGTGTMRLAYFTARKTESITQIRLFSGGTLAGATPTLIRAAVYSVAANGDLTELATTATDTSLFAAANTAYTKSLSGTVSKVAGQRYAIGELVVTGAAVPNGIGQSTINAVEATTIAPRIGGAVTGLADLPASPILNASVVASGNILYAVLLP